MTLATEDPCLNIPRRSYVNVQCDVDVEVCGKSGLSELGSLLPSYYGLTGPSYICTGQLEPCTTLFSRISRKYIEVWLRFSISAMTLTR